MDRGRFRRLEDLFHGARGRAPGEREAFLERECDGDRELLEEVRGLIAHEPRTALPLEPAAPGGFGDLVGERLGAFRLLRLLGEGGMGAVFEAEEEHPRRRVALKVLRLASASASARGRFMREIRLLAGLQHPGIAAIYEAGVARRPGGPELPFFAMELVQGARLDEFARLRRPSLEERLALVAEICDAVQHAHQRGVIHRDLKPGNILVVEDPGSGGAPRPKVLDFGIARATEGESETALLTRAGQILGTLAYMSPEQVLGDAAEQDTRSDVYSLGVILYELVCGRLPLDLDTSALPEAARRIREEEPERPARLAPGLHGDVETIALKALEKDPARRYQSAAELAEDLRRHLHGEPIAARSHSALYVLSRTMRRHRAVTGVALVSLLSVLVFAFQAARQARVKGRLADELARAATSLEDELSRSRLERGYLSTRLGAMLGAEDLLWSEFLRRPHSRDALWALRDLYDRFPCLSTQKLAAVTLVPHPDGRRVFSASVDGELGVIDLADLSLRVLGRSIRDSHQLALSPELGILCFSGGPGKVLAYDSETYELVETLELDALGGALAFLPDGRTLLAGSRDGRLFRIDARTWEIAGEEPLFSSGVASLDVSAEERRIAAGSGAGELALLDLEGNLRWRVDRAHDQSISALALSPDGRTLASGSRDKSIKLWDPANGRPLSTLGGSLGSVRELEFRGPAELHSVGWWSYDVWDPSTGGRRTCIPLGATAFLELPDEGTLLTTLGDVLRRWRLRIVHGGDELVALRGRSAAVFDASGRAIVLGDESGGVSVVDRASGAARTWSLGPNRIVTLAADAARDVLWVGENNRVRDPVPAAAAVLPELDHDRVGTVRLLGLAEGEERASFGGFQAVSLHSIDLDPARGRVAFARWGSGVEVRDARTTEVLWTTDAAPCEVVSVRFDPHGGRLAFAARDGLVRLFGPEGEPLLERWFPMASWSLAFSEDGRRLAVSTFAGPIEVWDVERDVIEAELIGQTTTWDLAFRPGHPGELVSSCADGTVRLWDLASRRTLLLVDAFDGCEALSVGFAPGGRELLATSAGGANRLFDLTESLECVRGNLAYQLERLGPSLGLDPARERARLEELLEEAARGE